ncbi:hypothetical protein M378DRAFT_6415 [Amanita muscaria Koide BX008]|uniref:VHS domain-containing protein n=1 Tax=Amanita muscaria (strain Koide BX008) TaxID=946122 RepID=A0A0C2XQ06_AMAMK|nr:hypothetical protein M378DRAFT_6415 [Amanita muscaria Koide BX008]
MSALNFAKLAFGIDNKPHSSVTEWVEILTSNKIEDEAYEGVPELVDAIDLQASGPAEAARALRKKLKHGQPQQQYRALVLIKALVENAGPKFHAAFSEGQLVDAFKQVSSDSTTDKRVKKKLQSVLASWRDQYRSEPSMTLFANLHKQCKGGTRPLNGPVDVSQVHGHDNAKEDKKKAKEETKKRQKTEREEQRRKEEEEKRNKATRARRVPFNLEKERPKVLSTIAEASQASSNFANALMLVNIETDSVHANDRVQECLIKAEVAKKSIVRYIQLVEDEDLIGALIETNDRINAALGTYEAMSTVSTEDSPGGTSDVTHRLSNVRISSPADETEEQASSSPTSAHGHPDLQDISFGPLGASSGKLPAPIKPSQLSDNEIEPRRGSLSDFSDYISSDEETHNARAGSSRRNYVDVSENSEDDAGYMHIKESRAGLAPTPGDDPFADPFADEAAVPTH